MARRLAVILTASLALLLPTAAVAAASPESTPASLLTPSAVSSGYFPNVIPYTVWQWYGVEFYLDKWQSQTYAEATITTGSSVAAFGSSGLATGAAAAAGVVSWELAHYALEHGLCLKLTRYYASWWTANWSVYRC